MSRWPCKPMIIKSVPFLYMDKPVTMKLNEYAGSAAHPIMCFDTIKAACRARWLHTTPQEGSGMAFGFKRMLCVLQVGTPGEGKQSIAVELCGQMRCTKVMPLEIIELPEEFAARGSSAQPREHFWVPGNGSVNRNGESS